MKKLLCTALLLTAGASAMAAPQTFGNSAFDITFDDSFLAGSTVSFSGSELTFSNLGNVSGFGPFNSLSGVLATVTAKAGYQLSGVTGTLNGTYSLSQENKAFVYLELSPFWSHDVVNPTVRNSTVVNADAKFGDIVDAPVSVTGSVAFASGTTSSVLQHVDAVGLILAEPSANASLSINTLRVSVQTSPTSAVPEPEAAGMALAGLAVAGVMLARRRKAA
jgi:hypothetical protein